MEINYFSFFFPATFWRFPHRFVAMDCIHFHVLLATWGRGAGTIRLPMHATWGDDVSMGRWERASSLSWWWSSSPSWLVPPACSLSDPPPRGPCIIKQNARSGLISVSTSFSGSLSWIVTAPFFKIYVSYQWILVKLLQPTEHRRRISCWRF